MKGYTAFPESSRLTVTSPTGCLVPYPIHSLLGGLTLCKEAVGIFYSSCRLGKGECDTILILIGVKLVSMQTFYCLRGGSRFNMKKPNLPNYFTIS